MGKPMFQLGKVTISDSTIQNVEIHDILHGLRLHISGDWGTVNDDFKSGNGVALARQEGCLISSYEGKDGYKFLIITNLSGHHNYTNIITPKEY